MKSCRWLSTRLERAKSYGDDVEFSPMDAARTDTAYLYDIIEATIEARGHHHQHPRHGRVRVPEQFGGLITTIRKNVPNIDRAVLSVHCHNDLGMAVINSLTALKNGARQAECTINGLGERAGNAALEEIVMAVKTPGRLLRPLHHVKTRALIATSRLVSRLMGIMVPPNKAIVGANAFAHSSGIHQDGVLKNRENFEIIDPRDVGLDATSMCSPPGRAATP